jgi:hypothetical protein
VLPHREKEAAKAAGVEGGAKERVLGPTSRYKLMPVATLPDDEDLEMEGLLQV